jgi:flagellum-specific peptidoglycan hydrolase FlgJ
MVTEQQAREFIAKIAPCAQYAYKTLGKVKPSICIGMACVECGYGTAGSCKHNSYLGQKVGTGKTATKYWSGTFFKSKTQEEYKIGVHTTIIDAFRSYESMQQCVLNYYELLNTKLYQRVKSDADYKTQMQQIKLCGYMTSSTEVSSVLSIIQKYNLTQYDNVTSPNVEVNPYKLSSNIIMIGDRNESVKWIQFELNKHGYRLAVDGIFGQKTKDAVIDYQKKNSVYEGIVGNSTISELSGV